MTVTTTNVKDQYTGTGGLFVFNVTFQFWDSDELDVFLRNISTGVEVLQIEGVNYSVSGGSGSTGQIDFTVGGVAPPASEEVHIRRNSNMTQQTDLTPRTSFPGEAVEEALDREALRVQEEKADRNERFLRIPVTDIPVSGTPPNMELPNKTLRAVANAVLGFDAVTGDPTIITDFIASGTPVSAFGATLVDDVDAAAARTTLGAVQNYDSGGGLLADAISIDLLANRDPAATMGQGLFFASDDGRFYVNTGAAYVEMVIKQFANASLPAPAAAGILILDTDTGELLRDTGSVLEKMRGPFPRGHLSGMKMSVINANDDISLSVGQCRAGTAADPDLVNAILTATLVKQSDATWAEGTNAGGMADALTRTANTWYHVFILSKPDGTTDAGFDTSVNAVNLLADAAVAAAGYTRFRRVGSIKTDATPNILDFIQSGDYFYWDSPTLDGDFVDITTTEVLKTANAPPDIKPMAFMNVHVNDGTQALVYVYSPDITSLQGSATVAPLSSVARGGASAGSGEQVQVILDASGQYATRADVAINNFRVVTLGWQDHLGRYD